LIFKKFLDLNGDGYVDKQEFEQVMKDKGKELNQDQIDIFNKKFQQDENAKVTYERMYFILPMSIIND
jgi:Ca2+-binding EF-hand superfamily protein